MYLHSDTDFVYNRPHLVRSFDLGTQSHKHNCNCQLNLYRLHHSGTEKIRIRLFLSSNSFQCSRRDNDNDGCFRYLHMSHCYTIFLYEYLSNHHFRMSALCMKKTAVSEGRPNLPFLNAASLHETISTSQTLPVHPGAHIH